MCCCVNTWYSELSKGILSVDDRQNLHSTAMTNTSLKSCPEPMALNPQKNGLFHTTLLKFHLPCWTVHQQLTSGVGIVGMWSFSGRTMFLYIILSICKNVAGTAKGDGKMFLFACKANLGRYNFLFHQSRWYPLTLVFLDVSNFIYLD